MLTIYPIESKGEKLSDFDKETAGRAPRVVLLNIFIYYLKEDSVNLSRINQSLLIYN